MNEELDYAEMLEIPVETVTVKRKERRRRAERDEDLSEQLVDQVNEHMQENDDDPAFAESKPIEREAEKPKRARLGKGIIIGEFVAVLALCATIFLTNIFMPESAINTFVRGLFNPTEAADTRTYSDFKLSPVINEFTESEIAVSESGVMSFTAKCSVYSPCAGEISSVNGDTENGYTVEIAHSDSFSTIISGLDTVYLAKGDTVRSNIPLGYTDGEGAVRVMFYSSGALLNCYSVSEDGLAWV